ncbi:MAG: beta-propeller fold lactonase family protein [Planctomycetes bacterium]|nr:beta-propeller fold lactonase family protein [Planctomycetota bacterium]
MSPQQTLRTSSLSLLLVIAACGGRVDDGSGSGGEDLNAPVITLLGDPSVTHELGTPYVDAGATATDEEDGDLTADIVVGGDVNEAVLGSYTLTYNVTDSAGNEADQVTRVVVVFDPNVVFTYSVPSFLGTAQLDEFLSQPQVGGAIATYSVDPALPAGISLAEDTGVISGTPTAKSPKTAYTITAVNSAGVGTATIELEVVPPVRFAYAANSDERTLSIFRCDSDSGQLFPSSYHFMTDVLTGDNKGKPQHVAAHPSGDWLIVTTNTDGLIVYSVDQADGSLTYAGGASLGAGAPHPLVISSAGDAIHVGGLGASPLRSFSFDATTGALTSAGAPIATSPIHALALSEDGARLVTLDRDTDTVRSFSVDESGAPTETSAYVISTGDAGELALSRDGSNAYVPLTHPSFDLIVRLPIDAAGVITDAEARPSPNGSDLAVLHPDGSSVFVASAATGELRRYPIDAESGEIDVLSSSDTASLGALSDLSIDAAGRFMHSADVAAGEVDLVHVDQDTLTLTAGASARARLGAVEAPALLRTQELLAIEPLTLYVSCGSSATLDAFEVDPETGLLTFLQTTPTQAEPRELVVGRAKDRLYLANYGANSLSTFEVQADGRLGTELAALSMSAQPIALALEPSGRFLYANSVNAKRVFGFEIQESDGTLRALDGGGGGVAVFSAALDADPTGRFLYCASQGEAPFTTPWPDGDPGTITVLHIDAETGHPTPLDDTVPGHIEVPFQPTFVAFDRTGARAYTNQTATGVNVAVPLDVAHADGDGTVITPGTPTGDTPTAIEISASGRFGYISVKDEAGGGALKLHDIYPDGSLRNLDTDTYTARATYLDVSDPIAIASDTNERWLYVLNAGTQSLSVWEINPADGTLTKLDELATSTDPVALHLNESL